MVLYYLQYTPLTRMNGTMRVNTDLKSVSNIFYFVYFLNSDWIQIFLTDIYVLKFLLNINY